jgi:hypothetical protein
MKRLINNKIFLSVLLLFVFIVLPLFATGAVWVRDVGLLPGTAIVFASDSPTIDRFMARIASIFYGNRVGICDGTADDVQIQAAETALHATHGGRILLSDGYFYFTTAVHITKSSVIIEGQGEGTTQIRPTACGGFVVDVNLYNAQFRNMSIYGLGAGNNIGINSIRTFATQIENVSFSSWYTGYQDDLSGGDHSYRGWIENCSFTDITNIAVNLQGSESFFITDCYFSKLTGPRFIGLDAGSNNILIDNCTLSGENSGGSTSNLIQTINAFEWTISNCDLFDFSLYAIMVNGGKGVIANNRIHGARTAGSLIRIYNTNNLTIQGNHFGSTATELATYVFSYSSTYTNFPSSDISGNIIRNSSLTWCPSDMTFNTSRIHDNLGYIARGEIRSYSGSLVPTGTCTATTVTGTFTESPLALKPGANTMHCTADGTINVVMPAGSTAVVTSIGGGATVTNSPKTCPAGATTLVTVATGGTNDFTITVHCNAFAWHNPELQDILVKKIVINRSAAGGTATSEMNVGIADNGTVDDPGIEFFDSILVNNAAAIHDSYVAGGTSYGTQTIWVNCQDSASATGGWVVGKLDTEIANALAGSYYIEYVGK